MSDVDAVTFDVQSVGVVMLFAGLAWMALFMLTDPSLLVVACGAVATLGLLIIGAVPSDEPNALGAEEL